MLINDGKIWVLLYLMWMETVIWIYIRQAADTKMQQTQKLTRINFTLMMAKEISHWIP